MTQNNPALIAEISQVRTEVGQLRAAVAEHTIRLENGRHVMHDIKERLPKPMGAGKLIGLSFGIFVALGGALWGLSEKLADRPTAEQIQSVIQTHDRHGHQDLRNDIRSIQHEQSTQRTLTEQMSAKLDKLIETSVVVKRAPRKRKR